MRFRHLGATGLKVASLCLGAMTFPTINDDATCFALMDEYVAAGGNFLDTANVYGRGVSESIIGAWLKARGNRHQMIIATKVGIRMADEPNAIGHARKHIYDACVASLRRLQTDYIDLYQTHYADTETPFEETLRALDDLQRAGYIRYAGASNYLASELVEALWTSDRANLIRYVCLQPHYNLIHRDEFERELMAVCAKFGLGVIPFFPLASGFLTGKYRAGGDLPESMRVAVVQRRYFNDRAWAVLAAVESVARELGASPAAVAIAWLMHRPTVTAPILGARTLDQLRDNLTAATVTLADDQIARL
ncbi:MAG: aldo/keto reductase, partial [Dehalococcoidia bacterium]|nr:aldo/keto reductase [Dehalococcoidia bacterium]